MLGDIPESAAVGPPETVTEFATELLRDRIVLGLLEPGAKLSVYGLADELGVSRVPLREAVRQLEAESLVDNIARRGTVVRPLRAADVRDAFAMLRAVEVIAAERAALADNDRAARQMRHWFNEMARLQEIGTSPRSAEMLHAHRAFHFAMFQGSGERGVLYRHLCMLWNTAERYVIGSRTPERQQVAHAEHQRLVELIEAKDAVGCAEVLRQHIMGAFVVTVQFLRDQGIEIDDSPV